MVATSPAPPIGPSASQRFPGRCRDLFRQREQCLRFSDQPGARLTVVFPPVFLSAVKSNCTLTLTWSAMAGQQYRLQYKPALTAANWTYLGTFITATAHRHRFGQRLHQRAAVLSRGDVPAGSVVPGGERRSRGPCAGIISALRSRWPNGRGRCCRFARSHSADLESLRVGYPPSRRMAVGEIKSIGQFVSVEGRGREIYPNPSGGVGTKKPSLMLRSSSSTTTHNV